ncbi:ferric-rhodotorulic acid outer membrane transporter [Escherichia coli]|nr:ferric-rhodotorulic acid outer membrane transporter [Escherichia coli]
MLSTQFNRDNQYQAITKPSLLAGCIALALLPSAAFAAPATEETVIVEGSATAPDDGENDYSVTSTSAGTKMQMTQRDIPQSVTIVSQQRMEDQQLQTLGEVMENTLGISKSQADSRSITIWLMVSPPILNRAGIWATHFLIWHCLNA